MTVLRTEISSLHANIRIGAYANGFMTTFEEKPVPLASTKQDLSDGNIIVSKVLQHSISRYIF